MDNSRTCPNCKNPVRENAKFCTHCGARYVETRKRCGNKECKLYDKPAPLLDDYCGECGSKLIEG